MKRIKFAEWIVVATTIFYIVYNSIFGWNQTPINDTELACDNLATCGYVAAWVFYLLPLMKVYEKFIKDWETKNKK